MKESCLNNGMRSTELEIRNSEEREDLAQNRLLAGEQIESKAKPGSRFQRFMNRFWEIVRWFLVTILCDPTPRQ